MPPIPAEQTSPYPVLDPVAPNPLGTAGAQLRDLLLRHFLTLAAGFLVAHGMIANGQSAQFVDLGLAILVAGAGLGWSWAQKRLARRVVQGVAAAEPHAVAS